MSDCVQLMKLQMKSCVRKFKRVACVRETHLHLPSFLVNLFRVPCLFIFYCITVFTKMRLHLSLLLLPYRMIKSLFWLQRITCVCSSLHMPCINALTVTVCRFQAWSYPMVINCKSINGLDVVLPMAALSSAGTLYRFLHDFRFAEAILWSTSRHTLSEAFTRSSNFAKLFCE